jgi:hypothetical protein
MSSNRVTLCLDGGNQIVGTAGTRSMFYVSIATDGRSHFHKTAGLVELPFPTSP